MDVINYSTKKSKDSKWIYMTNESETALKEMQQKRQRLLLMAESWAV